MLVDELEERVSKVKLLPKDKQNDFYEKEAILLIIKMWISFVNQLDNNISIQKMCNIPFSLLNISIFKEGFSERSYNIVKDYVSFIVTGIKRELEFEEEKGKIQLEISEKQKYIETLSKISTDLADNRIDKVNLQKIYLENKDKFENWVKSFGWTNDTSVRHINKNKEIFITNNIKYLNEYYSLTQREDVSTVYQFRKFIEFCKCYGLLSFNHTSIILAEIKSRKKDDNEGYDDYMPSFEEMQESIRLIKKLIDNPIKKTRKSPPISEIDLLLYKLSVESGARWQSIQRDCFKNFNYENLQIEGDVAVYRIKKPKKKTIDKKKGLFMFCRTKTIKRIIEIYEENPEHFKKKILHDFKRRLQNRTDNQLVWFKYHRNYGKSYMNSLKIDFTISDFIQSRLTKIPGWKNYSEKLNSSIEEYKKTLPHWKELFEENETN
jgi:intergrase/recombinase